MSPSEIRKNLRSQMKERRLHLTVNERIEASKRAFKHLEKLFSDVRVEEWLLYAPIHNEISTQFVLDFAHSRREPTYFPKVIGDEIQFFKTDEFSDLTPGTYALEPRQAKNPARAQSSKSLILVPGLAFSREAHRLGFGKGFYDRFLYSHPEALRLGLAYDFQIDFSWSPEPHDEILDFVLTPSAIWGSRRVL